MIKDRYRNKRNTQKKYKPQRGGCACNSGPGSGIFKGGNNIIENDNCGKSIVSLKGGAIPSLNTFNTDPQYMTTSGRLTYGGKNKSKKKRKKNKTRKNKKMKGGFNLSNLFNSSSITYEPSYNVFSSGVTIPTI